MIRKLQSFLVLIVASLSLSAQDKATPPASQLSGSLTLRVAEKNLLGSPYIPDVPGLSADLGSAALSLKFVDGLSYSYLDAYQLQDGVRRSTRMGYEAAIVLDAANLYSYTAQVSKYSSGGDYSSYGIIQAMIDWYENNSRRFGLPLSPYPSGAWPTDNYDGSSSGRTRFIYGKTVEPISYVAWDSTKWYDAQKLASEIKLKIELAIDNISADASSGKIVDQYAYAKMTQAKRALAQTELKAWTDFHVVSDGVDSKAVMSGPKFQSAYIKFTNIAGALDARIDLAGARLTNGRLVPSPRMEQPATGASLGFALPAGLLPGLSASVAASVVGGSVSLIENFETKNSEAIEGEASWLGLKLMAGYSVPDFASVDLSILWPDLVSRPLTVAATAHAKASRPGDLAWNVAAEGSFLLWQDRYIEDPAAVAAFAFGSEGGATIAGISPRALFLYKSEGFWGLGGNNSEDRFPGSDLRGDFDAAKVKDAAALDLGLGYDPERLLGASIVTIEGGYRIFIYGPTSSAASALGQGWYAGLGLSLLDALEIPLALAAKATNYANWGPYEGKYADWSKAPDAGLLTGLSWSANLDWEPSKEIKVGIEGSGRESGWRMDTKRIVSLGLNASIKF